MDRGAQFPDLYHGTDAELSPGDVVSPRFRPGAMEEYEGTEDVAHATTDYLAALPYAGGPLEIAPGVRQGSAKKRGKVYRVEPLDHEEVSKTGEKLRTQIPGHVASTKGFRVLGEAERPEGAPEYPRWRD